MDTQVDVEINDLKKVCNIVNVITNMDVRLLDIDGKAMLELINHRFPSVLENSSIEYQIINDTLKNNVRNGYYYYINSYGLEYIATGIWTEDTLKGSILIGPFLSTIPVTEFISDCIAKNKLPVGERKQLQEFYRSLTVISSNFSNSIGDLLVNMCNHKHIDSQPITTFSTIHIPIKNKEELKSNLQESKNVIELRYEIEKKLMNAIAKGDKEEIAIISKETNSIINIPDRIPESPIRSTKNLFLVLNTLCRIAAERGGIHPVYIDQISEKFAILIERSPNLPQLKNLATIMMNEYCDAVIKNSTRHLSPVVKKAVDYIHLHLDHSLSLNEIAAILHVNSSHLSRKFKQDMNMTIIDYINQRRVEEAKLYLQRGNISITEIAFMVGFNDLNYFTRVFKKFTSFTPSQYMKSEQDI